MVQGNIQGHAKTSATRAGRSRRNVIKCPYGVSWEQVHSASLCTTAVNMPAAIGERTEMLHESATQVTHTMRSHVASDVWQTLCRATVSGVQTVLFLASDSRARVIRIHVTRIAQTLDASMEILVRI